MNHLLFKYITELQLIHGWDTVIHYLIFMSWLNYYTEATLITSLRTQIHNES